MVVERNRNGVILPTALAVGLMGKSNLVNGFNHFPPLRETVKTVPDNQNRYPFPRLKPWAMILGSNLFFPKQHPYPRLKPWAVLTSTQNPHL